MRARGAAVAVMAILATTLVGCGGSGEPGKIRVTVTETVTPGSTARTGSATPRAGDARPGSAALREVRKFSSPGDDEYEAAAGTVTVLSYTQPVPSHVSAAEEVGAAGYVWGALEVKICATDGEFTTSSQPWTLAYADGARIEPSRTTYDDFPKPEYIEDADVTAGDCSRGKIVYPVPGGERPVEAIYSTDDTPAMKWSLP
ncbi:hypothetical protein [Streptomyces sp. F-1]|uniref:hypothetical protein n=1 Tax=Streptomyces sp. F-1 TaxID=463642 RepID=UPI00086ADC81|nr:hypothetical protein [Streptomyces sp. F-1]SFY50071.1 hypothetical protein STEPF1_03317 [Streptomyces sp. F-1]